MTQPEAEVPVSEGDPVTVKCTYSVSWSPYLFWYVQHSNQGLQFLLKYIGGDTLVKGNYGFEAEFNKSQTSFHLKKPSVVGSDSALYFCAVRGHFLNSLSEAKDMHREISARGLSVTCYSLGIDLLDESFSIARQMDFAIRNIEYAAALGSKFFHHTLVIGYDKDKMIYTLDDAYNLIADNRYIIALNSCFPN